MEYIYYYFLKKCSALCWNQIRGFTKNKQPFGASYTKWFLNIVFMHVSLLLMICIDIVVIVEGESLHKSIYYTITSSFHQMLSVSTVCNYSLFIPFTEYQRTTFIAPRICKILRKLKYTKPFTNEISNSRRK